VGVGQRLQKRLARRLLFIEGKARLPGVMKVRAVGWKLDKPMRMKENSHSMPSAPVGGVAEFAALCPADAAVPAVSVIALKGGRHVLVA